MSKAESGVVSPEPLEPLENPEPEQHPKSPEEAEHAQWLREVDARNVSLPTEAELLARLAKLNSSIERMAAPKVRTETHNEKKKGD